MDEAYEAVPRFEHRFGGVSNDIGRSVATWISALLGRDHFLSNEELLFSSIPGSMISS